MKKTRRNITIILAGVSFVSSCHNKRPEPINIQEAEVHDSNIVIQNIADSIKNWQEINFKTEDMVEKMVYADTTNFMHQNIYGCARCFLRPEVASALQKAGQLASKENLRLVIFDCYRPKVYQQKMFDIVGNRNYVAAPDKGSMHNKGLAVDLGLADKGGRPLDFGSTFDEFSEKSHFLYSGISEQAKMNRNRLRAIMTSAGFEPYSKEWWHFNYTKVKYPVNDFIWECN